MNISNYAAYFHDGSIIDIQQNENEIVICMESAEMAEDDLLDDIALSKRNCLKGALHLVTPTAIWIDGHACKMEKIQMRADSGDILDFEVEANRIQLFIKWINFPPKSDIDEYTEISIEAKKIVWENNPDLFDPFG